MNTTTTTRQLCECCKTCHVAEMWNGSAWAPITATGGAALCKGCLLDPQCETRHG